MRDSHAGGKKASLLGDTIRMPYGAVSQKDVERQIVGSRPVKLSRLKRGVNPRRMGQVEEVIFPTALECCLEQSQKGVCFFFFPTFGGGGAHQRGSLIPGLTGRYVVWSPAEVNRFLSGTMQDVTRQMF